MFVSECWISLRSCFQSGNSDLHLESGICITAQQFSFYGVRTKEQPRMSSHIQQIPTLGTAVGSWWNPTAWDHWAFAGASCLLCSSGCSWPWVPHSGTGLLAVSGALWLLCFAGSTEQGTACPLFMAGCLPIPPSAACSHAAGWRKVGWEGLWASRVLWQQKIPWEMQRGKAGVLTQP